MWKEHNLNPSGIRVGDCVIRAIAAVTGKSWDRVYAELAVHGFKLADMPSSNAVWASYLGSIGYKCNVLPYGYTIRRFADEYDSGAYIVCTGSHVVAVKDGDYLDTWDSGDESPLYYFYKEG